jgi:hypothetical protein
VPGSGSIWLKVCRSCKPCCMYKFLAKSLACKASMDRVPTMSKYHRLGSPAAGDMPSGRTTLRLVSTNSLAGKRPQISALERPAILPPSPSMNRCARTASATTWRATSSTHALILLPNFFQIRDQVLIETPLVLEECQGRRKNGWDTLKSEIYKRLAFQTYDKLSLISASLMHASKRRIAFVVAIELAAY